MDVLHDDGIDVQIGAQSVAFLPTTECTTRKCPIRHFHLSRTCIRQTIRDEYDTVLRVVGAVQSCFWWCCVIRLPSFLIHGPSMTSTLCPSLKSAAQVARLHSRPVVFTATRTFSFGHRVHLTVIRLIWVGIILETVTLAGLHWAQDGNIAYIYHCCSGPALINAFAKSHHAIDDGYPRQ